MIFFSFSDGVVITEPFQNHPSKIIALLISFLLTVIVNPFLYQIIKYESDQHYRTLINQLLSVVIYVVMGSTIFQVILHYRFTFGMVHTIFCDFDMFFKSCVAMSVFLLLDYICIVRYIFVFHLKNPAASQDEFWLRFIVIWIFAFTFVTNVVCAILPGTNPNFYYLCLGKVPKGHDYLDAKPNVPLLVCLFLTIMLHACVAVRYQIHKYKDTTRTLTAQQSVTTLKINKSSIVNFATNCAAVVYLYIVSYVPNRINFTDPVEYNKYPEYLWLYAFSIYLSSLNQFFVLFVLTSKNAPLRNFIKRQISEVLKIFYKRKKLEIPPTNVIQIEKPVVQVLYLQPSGTPEL